MLIYAYKIRRVVNVSTPYNIKQVIDQYFDDAAPLSASAQGNVAPL